MPLAITDDHRDIADAVRSFLTGHDAATLARRVLDDPNTDTTSLWKQLAELGWLGLHLPSRFGGEDVGLPEVAIVAEELGRLLVPVPFLASVATSATVAAAGNDEQKSRWLPGLADGSTLAGLGIAGSLSASGTTISGDAGLVVGAVGADVLALVVGDDLVLVSPDDSAVTIIPASDFEPTLRLAHVLLDNATASAVVPGAAGRARHIARTLAAAESAGGARATLDAALDYAKVREQFGRAIGSFQAIKHHLANMLATSELAVAVAWDAARAGTEGEQAVLALDAARVLAFDSYIANAEKSIQIHGGIGFTWEHDCHLHLRRAQTLRALFGEPDSALDSIVESGTAGVRRHFAVDLPAEAETFRTQAREFAEQYHSASEADRRALLVDSGYLMPHWAKPYGRAASPVEQLVIDEEFDGIDLPNLGIGAWILLTLTQHGNAEQIERWIRPGLMGDLVWCQLFSEPGAGSDAAAVSTRGVKVDGGWRITGQKVWTSNAQNCNRGLATIRTNRDVPKHKGITAVVVDLHAPGVTVRPLREITGDAVFNEVFFDDVFVPDEDVVGAVDNGWAVARATLGNERVSIGGGSTGGEERSAYMLLDVAAKYAAGDVATNRAVAALVAREQAMGVLNVRNVVRAVAGGEPGPEGSISKMLVAEHSQHVGELALRIAGPAVVAGDEPQLAYNYLLSRAMTIAGGTSEVNRNVIAERILGLPREHIAN
ncbi:alkylation response protein AidB-like acyl-CoA dehydrogenase [Rhodococcus rhodochrous J45]|uniref:Alkylation response protein AidB-like acyl-CoA dehydrogenase n=1 Tax=Rhodococcus rhodochrous J45 TaxID=935266 RepID=A0A562E7Q1_RHORH|nr:acyl-CoA dehydrogenase [Rhodococcus rhodochrous]TWH18045.1 alkylation response protein AidB-like acyl-CoA dehydrogenase [Rhodococcus rhodochrous J45]